ncbi:M96 mating-specific protein family, partial [Phytophthora palmivora]
QNLETTDDTIVESFGLELHAKETQADFRVKQILRRYVDEDRVVIVWRSFIDPVEFSGAPLRGAEFREKGYIVIRRPSGMAENFSLLQTCYLIHPETPVHSLSDEGAITGALTDFVLSGTAANIAAGHQMIENILFNEAMKTHSRVLKIPNQQTMPIALEDDSDAFTAALCFVDEFMTAGTDEAALSIALEGFASTLGGSPTDPSLSGAGQKMVKKRKGDELSCTKAATASAKACKTSRSSTRNRVRDQERRELLYLREKVADMQQKLQALQKTRVPAITVEVKQPVERRDEDEEAPAVWKEMASHQLEQRLKSERENRQLKMVLEGQLKIAKSLEKLLQARATTNVSCLGDGQRLKRMHMSTPDRSDANIFKELMEGIDLAYREVDAVFHDNGLDTKESSFNDAEIHEGADGVYMKIFASKVLPFDVTSTGTAAWRYFSRSLEHMPFRFLYHKDLQNVETTDDTIIESFGMELHAKGTQADYRVKQIVRRYVEENRVVIVWRSYIDPVSFAGNPVYGAQFQEKGYLVVRRPRAMSPRFALLQTCYLISPALPIRSLSDERSVTGELTDFVLSGTEANVASCHQMIENILFNEAMKAHSKN